MKSIKPGRGPSAMGFMESIFAAIFGVFWIFMAVSMGAPIIFPVFGIMFIVMAIVQAVYHYKNTTGKERFSTFDITDDGEEIDPLEQRFGNNVQEKRVTELNIDIEFCPYCGTKVASEYDYCVKCGKKLP